MGHGLLIVPTSERPGAARSSRRTLLTAAGAAFVVLPTGALARQGRRGVPRVRQAARNAPAPSGRRVPAITRSAVTVTVTDTTATVEWETNVKTKGKVKIQAVSDARRSRRAARLRSAVVEPAKKKGTLVHQVIVPLPQPGKRYDYTAISTAGKKTVLTSTNYLVAAPTGTGTPPQITSGPTVSDETGSTAKVTWTTNVPTCGWVRYQMDAPDPVAFQTFSATTGTTHAVTLTGLSPSTAYAFTVGSTAGAFPAATANGNFTTGSAAVYQPRSNFNSVSTPSGLAVTSNSLTLLTSDKEGGQVVARTRPDTASNVWSSVATLGSPGSGDAQFNSPWTIAITADDLTAFVADTNNNRVSVWRRSGPGVAVQDWTHQVNIGTLGSGIDRLRAPEGVATFTTDLGDVFLYVADTGNSRVSVWELVDLPSTFEPRGTFGGYGSGSAQFARPTDVAVSADGSTILVADADNNRVAVWVANPDRPGAWVSQGTFGTFGSGPTQFNQPVAVDLSPDGLTAWVCDYANNRVAVWGRPHVSSQAWANQTTFGSLGSNPDQFAQPFDVAASPANNVYFVADYGNSRISIWETA